MCRGPWVLRRPRRCVARAVQHFKSSVNLLHCCRMAPIGIMAAAGANDSSSDSDEDFQQSKKDGSRKRSRAYLSPMMAGIFAATLPSADAVKDQLLVWNPQCVPRIRGSGANSKHVRFSCKKEGSGCGLNVSCVKINSGLSFKMSAATYRPGNCSELKLGVQSVQSHASHAPSAQPVQSVAPSAAQPVQSVAPSAQPSEQAEESILECCLCSLVISLQIIRCQHGHLLCQGCFNNMVRNQVTGVGKARFVVSKTVHCVVCRPQTAFSMRDGSQYLYPDVWTSYLSAISEADVVAEQQRFEAILKNHQQAVLSPLQQAMEVVRSRIQPQCPKCSMPLPDFEACASIVCGRVVGLQGGAVPSLGCGALLFCSGSIYLQRSVVARTYQTPDRH